jgi:hypothetical protein
MRSATAEWQFQPDSPNSDALYTPQARRQGFGRCYGRTNFGVPNLGRHVESRRPRRLATRHTGSLDAEICDGPASANRRGVYGKTSLPSVLFPLSS